MKELEILKSLNQQLKTIGVSSLVLKGKEKESEHCLLIETGTKKTNIKILVAPFELGKHAPSDIFADKREYVRVQLDATFPYSVALSSMADMAQVLHFLNLQVDLPGFYLNLADKEIIYRYVLLADMNYFPEKILLSIIGIAMLFQDVFAKTFKELAEGKATFLDVMEEIQNSLKN